MNIINDFSSDLPVNKSEIEQVQQQQKEYFLLGTFLRSKGLKLFAYNSLKNTLSEVEIRYSDTLHFYLTEQGPIVIDWENQKCTVDSRNEYFEALNFNSAIRRVEKYKRGEVKYLSNLREPSKEGIKFF